MTSLYELSKQLAEAGFPQPHPKAGQTWWIREDWSFLASAVSDFPTGPYYYQPLAEEVLALLPDYVALEKYTCLDGSIAWTVFIKRGVILPVNVSSWDLHFGGAPTALHACARAYLSYKQVNP